MYGPVLFKRQVHFTRLHNKPTIVCKYPRNGTSVGVLASGLEHCTMKRTIEVLACWNCTQHMFCIVVLENSGYSHENDYAVHDCN